MYLFLVNLLQPFPLLLLVGGIGQAIAWWKSPGCRRWLWLPAGCYLLLYAISTPAVAYYAAGVFEWPYRPLRNGPGDAEAIVVLGGGRIPASEVEPRTRLPERALRRCWCAGEIYRQGEPRLVLVTGGKVDGWRPGVSEAEAMRRHLLQLGVPDGMIVVEEEARDTLDNARRCGELLGERGLNRILLVTDAVHMPRARRCFEREGLEVIPAVAHYETHAFEWEVSSLLPDAGAAQISGAAFHEILGGVWFRLRAG